MKARYYVIGRALQHTVITVIGAFLAAGSIANAAIPVTYERALQSGSPEKLLIEAQSVQKKRNLTGSVDLEVKAKVIAVEKSATGLKEGDSLTIRYWIPDPGMPLPAGAWPIEIEKGKTYTAYLGPPSGAYRRLDDKEKKIYFPAAVSGSFHVSSQIPAADRTQVTWPPPEMKDLPADYLDRLRWALQLQSDRFDDPKTKGKGSVVKVRIGIAGLALGQHVDELNAYFEADGFGWKPSEQWGFSLFSASYLRLYALYNDRTGVMKGRLSPKAQENLEKSFWECARAYSKLAEAKIDVWESDGSENHHITSRVSDFLVAQFLKDIPAYASLKYDDGSTLKQQYEARLDYWSKWLDQRARRGLFYEDGSSYENYTIEALFNLRDFAEDRVLRRKADMFLDLVFANMAEETLGSVRGGPKTRTKEEGFEARYYGLLFNQGERFRESGSYLLPTSSYYPPPVIVSLGRDASNRGAYSWSKRAPGFKKPPRPTDPPKWYVFDDTNSIIRNGFTTTHFHIGSHGVDATAEINRDARQQRWQGVVFANDPMARISMDGVSVKGTPGNPEKDGYIGNPFKTIQDRNIMITRKWGPSTDRGVDPNLWIYFSHALDRVEEEDEWIFAKAGDAFAAVKVVGGYQWVTPWKHRDSLRPKSFVRLLNPDSPIITIADDAADYNGDFKAFKKALKAQPITWADGVLKFATITHQGPLAPGKVNGKPVELRPPRVNDSPFIRSDWDSGIIYVRKGKETLKLDFSDPGNPIRTVDARVTSEFPPGIGTATPILFER